MRCSQCRLKRMGTLGSFPGATRAQDPMLIYVWCLRHVFNDLNTGFVGSTKDLYSRILGSTNTINICLILSTINIFIPVCGCGGRSLSALSYPGGGHIMMLRP